MTIPDRGEPQVAEVHLLRIPIRLYARAEERQADLVREFALIAATQPEERVRVPRRLLALIDRVQARYGGYGNALRASLQEARKSGVEAIDVSLTVPVAVADAAAELLAQLEEADEFCRSGALLTLAAPDDLVRFRRWYLGEFVAQTAGAPPTPWSELPS